MVFIVKNVMDETTYQRIDNKNVLTLKRKIYLNAFITSSKEVLYYIPAKPWMKCMKAEAGFMKSMQII